MMTGDQLRTMSDNQLVSWLEANRQSLQRQMASLRTLAQPIHDRKISNKTKNEYWDDFARVEKAGTVLAASGSKPSFFKLRAAAKRTLADRVYLALAKADAIRKKNEFGLIRDLKWAAFILDELQPLGAKLAQFTSEKWDPNQVKAKERSHKQRSKLGRLPKDWRAQIWARTGKGKYGNAVAVGALAGARPEELEKGVEVQLLKDGRLLFIVIGAKTRKAEDGKAAQGQALRSFAVSFEADNPMAQRLKEKAARGRLVVRVASACALSTAFCKASKNTFPRMTGAPSFYTFRHGFSASAKASGLSPEEVAYVMGHASTASQQHYGMKSQGSGGLKVTPIGNAPTPIRVAPTCPPPTTPAAAARKEARAIDTVLPNGVGARSRAPRPRL